LRIVRQLCAVLSLVALLRAQLFEAELTKAGIQHTFKISEGRHEWTAWRHNLNDVAPLLFR